MPQKPTTPHRQAFRYVQECLRSLQHHTDRLSDMCRNASEAYKTTQAGSQKHAQHKADLMTERYHALQEYLRSLHNHTARLSDTCTMFPFCTLQSGVWSQL